MVAKPPMTINHTPVNCWREGDWPGRAALPVRAIVFHVQDGTQAGSIAWAHNPVSKASANYYMDTDGSIVEVVDPDRRAPFANGIQHAADTDLPPALADLRDGDPNANWVTVSIELAGRPFSPSFPSAAQVASAAKLAAWLCDKYRLAPSEATFTRHRQYSTRDRPNCPGPHFDMAGMIARVQAILDGAPAPTDDQLLEAAWQDTQDRLGPKQFAGLLDRAWGGKALFCAFGVLVVNDGRVQDVTQRVLEDAATYMTLDGSLVRL